MPFFSVCKSSNIFENILKNNKKYVCFKFYSNYNLNFFFHFIERKKYHVDIDKTHIRIKKKYFLRCSLLNNFLETKLSEFELSVFKLSCTRGLNI